MPKVMNYTRDSIIFFEGDKDERIFILQSGNIVLTKKDLLSGVTLSERLSVGEFFGVKSALAHKPRMETANVLADSVVLVLTITEFEQIVSPRQDVILKMLRVFSRDLRNIHHKIEAILKTEAVPLPPEEGMLKVAKAFCDEGQYHSSVNVCQRIAEKFPSATNLAQVKRLFTDAKLQADRAAKNAVASGVGETTSEATNEKALRQFDLPMFERFSKTYKDGDVIICEFEPGDCFYLIQSGTVQLEKCIVANGTIKNLDILHPGEFFGEMAILDNSPRSATCIAKGSVKCLEFNKANFQLLVTSNPQIAMVLLKIFCRRIYDQHRRFSILTIEDLQARIADVFLMFEEMNPGPSDLPRRKFPLTMSDVAHWAGISLDSAHEELNKYSAKNKIAIHDTFITVSSIAEMQRIVDSYHSVYGRDSAVRRHVPSEK